MKLFCAGVDSLRAHTSYNEGALTLSSVRATPQGAIARFAQITDRAAAEALRGTALTIPRDALPPLADGDYYHADLIGLPVLTCDGENVGTCVAVDNFGAGDILDIQKPDGATFMVPMKADSVLRWDAGGIVIDPAFLG